MQVDRVRELEVRYRRVRTVLPVSAGRVAAPQDAAALSVALLADSPVERVLALHLNTRHELIGIHRVSVGCLDSAIVHPREVFQAAILSNAAAIVLVHNHPSGDPTPSPDDIALVRRLREASVVMGIDFLDALIVGDAGRYHSFKQTGVL
jgi:DNA repair protein RadC